MQTVQVIVHQLRSVASGVVEVTLVAENQGLLPKSTPGAHIDLHLPNGQTRAYSLTQAGSLESQSRYVVAVGLAACSRGGSSYVHHNLALGQVLTVGTPRNLFALVDDPAPAVLIAGGIGITPLLAMAMQRLRQELPWDMVYAARSRAGAAYATELAAFADHVRFHFDDENHGRALDLHGVLVDISPQTHIYCCGPLGLMEKVRELAAGHPSDHLHFESFGGNPRGPTQDNRPFVVELARKRKTVDVAAHQSILEALETCGVVLPSVCREGVCGSCECAVLEGEVDHRDQILSPEDKASHQVLMACVSRARGERLVLDI